MRYGLEERIFYYFMILKKIIGELLSEESIGYVSRISALYADSNYVWISSTSGLKAV